MIVIDNNAIHIVDSVMGTGKTQACIAWMRQHPEQKYLYVTPYLDECSRIQASAPELDFQQPQENKTKSADLLRLLSEGKNITTTHELLSLMKDSDVEYIKKFKYILFLDEELSCIENLSIESAALLQWIWRSAIRNGKKVKVRLIDKDGKVIRPTIKNIVRAKYDSEYCQDKIPDKPNEEWYFIDEWFLKGLRNCREALLISNYCRIKTYTGYNAKILHQYENAAGYFEILPQSDGKQVHIKVHRLEAFYFVRQVEGKMWITPEIFQDLAIHHLKTKEENTCLDLYIPLSVEEHAQLDAERRRRYASLA